MPRTKTYLTPAEYAVLGLLRQKPAYGYELQRLLSGDHGLARVCRVEPAMVYAILKSLSGLELIDGEWDRSVYPPKAVYSLTQAGEVEFERWLRLPVGRMREVRFDFLIKLYFAMTDDPRLARELVDGQVEVCRTYTNEVEQELGATEASLFDAIVLQSKASAAKLTLDWLEQCRKTLAEDPPPGRGRASELPQMDKTRGRSEKPEAQEGLNAGH